MHRWNYLFKNGFDLKDALAWIEKRAKEQSMGTALALLVKEKRGGKVLGEMHVDFDLGYLAADIGYATVYGKETQGKGYATEAAMALIGTLCHLGLQKIVLTAAPLNLPSRKVISKLGIPQVEGVELEIIDANGTSQPRLLFHMAAKDWMARQGDLAKY